MAQFGRASELTLLVGTDNEGGKITATQIAALVSSGAPLSRYTFASELTALVSSEADKNMVSATEVVVLVSVVEGGTERFNSRAWGFNLDQHQFYVLHLGMEGTFVYDVLSSEWAQWQTQGFVNWNAEAGVEWNGDVYFGDNQQPILWRMTPTSFLDDDFRPIERIVTGGIPVRKRGMWLCHGAYLAASVGTPDPVDGSTVRLRFSDDFGATWFDAGSLTIDLADNTKELAWRSLGSMGAPGRVFEIADFGGLVRIDGLDLDTDLDEQ